MDLVVRIDESLEKAKSLLIFRSDLPWKKPDGSIGYRKGWVRPEDSKALDKHRAAGGMARDMLHIKHEEDLFDQGEGEAWGHDEAPVSERVLTPGQQKAIDKWKLMIGSGHLISMDVEAGTNQVGGIFVNVVSKNNVHRRYFVGPKGGVEEKDRFYGPEVVPVVAHETPEISHSGWIFPNKPNSGSSVSDKIPVMAVEKDEKAPLYIEDLTDKAIIIRGDTRTHKDALKAARGRWNGKYGGWIFPKSWEERVRKQFYDLLQPAAEPDQSVGTPVAEQNQNRVNPAEKPVQATETPAPEPVRPDVTTTPEYIKLKKAAISDMGMVAAIDQGKAPGYDRALFVSSIVGKIKRSHANGNQAIVDAVLDYMKELQTNPKYFTKPVISATNGVWKLHSQYGRLPQQEVKPEPAKPAEQPKADPAKEKYQTIYDHYKDKTDDRLYDVLGRQPGAEGVQAIKDILAERGLPAERHVGDTKTEGGFTYRLNENHRWELLPQKEPSPPGPAPKAEPAPELKTIEDVFAKYKGDTGASMALIDYKDWPVDRLERMREKVGSQEAKQLINDVLKVKKNLKTEPVKATEEPEQPAPEKPVDPEPVPDSHDENHNGTSVSVTLDPDLRGQHNLEVSIAKTKFRDYGSWSANGRHVSAKDRAGLNAEIEAILKKPRSTLTQAEVDKIRRYSGFGGVDTEGERGALYDYFTSPPVAKMVYQVMNKITPIKPGSKILEPSCGGGVFFDVSPENVELHGVEYDPRTAAVASIVQDRAAIHPGSFEQFNLHNDDKFDHIIGNAPFGDRSVQTSFMDMPGEGSLDRYFVRRSLDNLKDGGSMAMIVAPGVLMNKGNREWRAEIMKHGQFMGAIKLPDSSFKHTHTGVSPDVLIFRKYPEEVRMRLAQLEENGMKQAGFWNDGWVDGNYFDLPEGKEHILGEKKTGNWGRMMASGDTSPEALDDMVQSFAAHEELNEDHLSTLREMTKDQPAPQKTERELRMTKPEAAAFAAKTLTEGMTKTMGGKVYRLNKNHRWELVEGADEKTAEKLDNVKAIAEAVKAVRSAMQYGNPADDLQAAARGLVEAYKEKYGVSHTEDRDIKRILKADAKISGVYEALSTELDSDILTKTNLYDRDVVFVDGHNPAIGALMVIGEQMAPGTEENIRRYYPKEAEALIAEMYRHPDVFLTAAGEWQLREDFITGNAWEKIDSMNQAAAEETNPIKKAKYEYAAAELAKAIGWVTIEDAEFTPMSNWIPVDIVNAWVQDENGMNQKGTELFRDPETGKWSNRTSGKDQRDQYTPGFGRPYKVDAPVDNDIMYFMNGQKQRSSYNDTATYNANALSNFETWVMNNPEARARLEELYNRNYNTELGVPTKTYAVNLDGWNPEVVLGGHQWQTIHHLYRQGRGISALGTGFGKTKAGVALMALLRQEGKAKRFFLQVPNNKVQDWVDEINGCEETKDADGNVVRKRKPGCMKGLKVGYVTTDMKGWGDQATRFKKYQEVANGDYDVVIFPESAASEIGLNPENDELITESVILDQMMDGKKRTGRQKEEKKNTLEGQMVNSKKNKTITFEDFGCDSIMVDEFHNYKNLFSSSLSRETGLNDGRRSERALAMFKKMEWMRRKMDNKNVFGLTATPLTNSPLEYYNLMQHIAPEELQSKGIANINDFITNFAEIVEGEKYDWATGQTKMGKKLESFRNIRALQDMFFKYTDMQIDSSKIGLKKPKANNHPNILPKDEGQTAVMRGIADELEKWAVDKKNDKLAEGDNRNFLTFYSKMRTASLDLELMDPIRYKGWRNPKIEALADNAWKDNQANNGGQVIFCDRILSSDGSFNIHEKVKARLVAQGFKPEDIIIVNGITKAGGKMSDSALEKSTQEAIEAFNSGKYKVIIGTTGTIGEGVNLQRNSSGLHHLDIPYRPSDIIQRNGRIDRQGNKQSGVTLHTYATAGTIDNYSMNLVMQKEGWINKLLKTKSNVFLNPNEDGVGADADEMMLALTEEWGESDKAEERRAKIAQDRAESAKKLHQENMQSSLELLSKVRGSLRGYEGDRGNLQYQNRLKKLSGLEASLANNPEFKHLDLLGDNPSDFIYAKKDGRVFKIGDALVNKDGVYRITEINHKKQTFKAEFDGHQPTVHLKTIDWSAASGFGSWRNDKTEHVPNPTETDLRRAKMITNIEYFNQGTQEEKAAMYFDLATSGGKSNGLPIFTWNKDHTQLSISLKGDYETVKPQDAINPYTPEGQQEIADIFFGKTKGVGRSGYRETEALEAAFGEDHPIVRERKLSEFHQMTGASKWESDTADKDEVSLREYAAKNGFTNHYSATALVLKHPDWTVERDQYDFIAKRKKPLQKALVIPVSLKPQKLGILVGRG